MLGYSRYKLRTSCFLAATAAALGGAASAALAADPVSIVRSSRTGLVTFVSTDNAAAAAPARAANQPADDPLAYLATHADLFGIVDVNTQLRLERIEIDELGWTHFSYQQMHGDLPVFSGILKVHRDIDGRIRSANGRFYPLSDKLTASPAVGAADAEKIAVDALQTDAVYAETSELVVVDPGWYGDPATGPQVAHHLVMVDAELTIREAFFVEAQTGEILDRWSMIHDARSRSVHDAGGTNSLPGPVARTEGQGATGNSEVDRAYDYAGDTYDYFFRGFGRDSLNNGGMTLIATVNSTAGGCPNARWNGAQSMYCTGLATDDVIGHEFTHGLTQFTAGLIYQNQSGQLNESFSDVFGEMIDLFNGNAAFAGPPGGPAWPTHGSGPGLDTPNNLRTTCSDFEAGYPNGVRWMVGEEINASPLVGAIRDMWDPPCEGDPDRANSSLQTCNANDAGGVHSGSGIPNHAFAMLTDGKTFNGQTISAIGPIKTGAVWYRALTVYLTPASDFEDATYAFNQAAADLIGTTPSDPRTGGPSASAFTAGDAAQVATALIAVEMNTAGACGSGDDVLNPNTPSLCANRTTIFADAFESGVNGWTVSNSAPLTPFNWVQLGGTLPWGHTTTVWYCDNPSIGDCGASDESGSHSLFSPTINLPGSANFPMIKFEHYLETEGNWDGGNVKIRVNGGAWEQLPRSAFLNNPYNGRMNTVGQGNTNPLAGESAFTGAGGQWGVSIIDLSSLTNPGDSVQFRFDLGKDGCTGLSGWYVDNFELFNCPDCDGNGTADVRQYRFNTASAELGNIGSGSPQQFVVTSPPQAGGDVLLTIHAMGDFSSTAEFIDVSLNGAPLGSVLQSSAADCGFTPERATLLVPQATYNAALGGGNATFDFVATSDVNAGIGSNNCSGTTYVSLYIDYPRTVADCNSDGIPDACDGGPPAIVTQPQPQAACEGGSATFSVVASGAAALAYQWQRNSVDIPGATGTSLTINPVGAGDAGTYRVRVSNPCGSVNSNGVALTIRTPVSITQHPTNQSACAGGSASFTVAATGSPTIAYQWQRNTVSIPGATSATYTDNNVQAGDVGSYRCVVTNPCGSVNSNSATLSLLAGVDLGAQPQSQTICRGQPATFSVTVTGGAAPIAFQWQKNTVDIPGATATSYNIPAVQPADAGSYRVIVTNPCGSATSSAAVLTVNEAPAISTQPQPQTVCEGEPASFSVTATGTPAPTYQWRRNSANIGGATSATYSIPAAAPGDAGSYDVVVTNSCGSITSDTAVLTVDPCPSGGDMNCDGSVDFFDIDPFLLALFNPPAYQAQFPACNILNGDLDNSGAVDFFDIDPFLNCLFNGVCG